MADLVEHSLAFLGQPRAIYSRNEAGTLHIISGTGATGIHKFTWDGRSDSIIDEYTAPGSPPERHVLNARNSSILAPINSDVPPTVMFNQLLSEFRTLASYSTDQWDAIEASNTQVPLNQGTFTGYAAFTGYLDRVAGDTAVIGDLYSYDRDGNIIKMHFNGDGAWPEYSVNGTRAQLPVTLQRGWNPVTLNSYLYNEAGKFSLAAAPAPAPPPLPAQPQVGVHYNPGASQATITDTRGNVHTFNIARDGTHTEIVAFTEQPPFSGRTPTTFMVDTTHNEVFVSTDGLQGSQLLTTSTEAQRALGINIPLGPTITITIGHLSTDLARAANGFASTHPAAPVQPRPAAAPQPVRSISGQPRSVEILDAHGTYRAFDITPEEVNPGTPGTGRVVFTERRPHEPGGRPAIFTVDMRNGSVSFGNPPAQPLLARPGGLASWAIGPGDITRLSRGLNTTATAFAAAMPAPPALRPAAAPPQNLITLDAADSSIVYIHNESGDHKFKISSPDNLTRTPIRGTVVFTEQGGSHTVFTVTIPSNTAPISFQDDRTSNIELRDSSARDWVPSSLYAGSHAPRLNTAAGYLTDALNGATAEYVAAINGITPQVRAPAAPPLVQRNAGDLQTIQIQDARGMHAFEIKADRIDKTNVKAGTITLTERDNPKAVFTIDMEHGTISFNTPGNSPTLLTLANAAGIAPDWIPTSPNGFNDFSSTLLAEAGRIVTETQARMPTPASRPAAAPPAGEWHPGNFQLTWGWSGPGGSNVYQFNGSYTLDASRNLQNGHFIYDRGPAHYEFVFKDGALDTYIDGKTTYKQNPSATEKTNGVLSLDPTSFAGFNWKDVATAGNLVSADAIALSNITAYVSTQIGAQLRSGYTAKPIPWNSAITDKVPTPEGLQKWDTTHPGLGIKDKPGFPELVKAAHDPLVAARGGRGAGNALSHRVEEAWSHLTAEQQTLFLGLVADQAAGVTVTPRGPTVVPHAPPPVVVGPSPPPAADLHEIKIKRDGQLITLKGTLGADGKYTFNEVGAAGHSPLALIVGQDGKVVKVKIGGTDIGDLDQRTINILNLKAADDKSLTPAGLTKTLTDDAKIDPKFKLGTHATPPPAPHTMRNRPPTQPHRTMNTPPIGGPDNPIDGLAKGIGGLIRVGFALPFVAGKVVTGVLGDTLEGLGAGLDAVAQPDAPPGHRAGLRTAHADNPLSALGHGLNDMGNTAGAVANAIINPNKNNNNTRKPPPLPAFRHVGHGPD
jgi:hypothetical protein